MHADISKDEEGIVIVLMPAMDDGLVAEKQQHTAKKSRHSVSNSNEGAAIKDKIIVHTVVQGDTLWHIAKRYIDNPYKYTELARLSRIKNPDLIYPGDTVKIIYKERRRK